MINNLPLTFTRFLLAAVTLFTFAAPARAELKQLDHPPGKATLKIFGDVKTVLDGQSTGPLFQRVDAASWLLALGCASINDDPSSQGETLFVSGTAFVKSVDPTTSYATQRARGKCHASFLAGLSPDSKATARYSIDAADPVSVDALYKQLHRKHGALLAISGTARFSVLALSAVKKAPIYGESIIGPKRADYFHPTEIVANPDVFFYGLSLRSNADATNTTRKIFYINPANEISTAGQSHTHCGILKPSQNQEKPAEIPTPDTIATVAHVLTQSRIVSGEISVYELTE